MIIDTWLADSLLFMTSGMYLALVFISPFFNYDFSIARLFLGAFLAGCAFGNVFMRLIFRRLKI